jgi:hypothetical protein
VNASASVVGGVVVGAVASTVVGGVVDGARAGFARPSPPPPLQAASAATSSVIPNRTPNRTLVPLDTVTAWPHAPRHG